MEFDPTKETAASLRARAERCRALARVARLPFAAQMLERLAEQFDGEAARLARPPERRQDPLGAPP
jgi:hypothetical protein